MDIDTELKDALGTRTWKKLSYGASGGCISTGETFEIDGQVKVFVKRNPNEKARLMFDGEFQSLKVIRATETVRVPKPMAVINDPKGPGAAFAMEYLDIQRLSDQAAKLGDLLADMHLFNQKLGKKQEKAQSWVGGKAKKQEGEDDESLEFVDKFGFDIVTCCGYIPQDNQWVDEWLQFFARNRLDHQMRLIESEHGDREARELWSHLQLKIPQFFAGIEQITPSLLHGDLWGGNAGQLFDEPVIFDPASFYGHSEFELSISKMFGGFSKNFYDAYHKKLPKEKGFDQRMKLYQIFHYLNHWNHFGSGYRRQSLDLMRSLS